MVISKNCVYCDSSFCRTNENNFNWNQRRYCSQKCCWNYHAKRKRERDYNPKKICRRCGIFFFKEHKKYGYKYCKSCSQECKHKISTKRKDIWFLWEENILRNMYYNSTKDELLDLLPRTWSAINHRAERLGIKRNPKFTEEGNKKGREWFKNNNPMLNPIYKKKARDSLIKLYKEHPEKLPMARLRRNQMTNIEKEMAKLLDSLGIKYKWNKYVKTKTSFKFPDFRIGKLIIECDGIYWHKDRKEEDNKREKELEEVGFEVIRFNDTEILKNIEKVREELKVKLKVNK